MIRTDGKPTIAWFDENRSKTTKQLLNEISDTFGAIMDVAADANATTWGVPDDSLFDAHASALKAAREIEVLQNTLSKLLWDLTY